MINCVDRKYEKLVLFGVDIHRNLLDGNLVYEKLVYEKGSNCALNKV